ncbi:type II toxin-antitoxin system YafQ family toxin [Gardnerella vaginalis]|uniref:Addiction module toxin, RelE/StbE family n=1 Tax=Gardnerella vaginalis TaxID=2702 RepID=A0A133NQ69_GARVA|nr:type II toxin-antitoxin system YafQ family toxin [Gardnerella vaginalis]KXA18417.1 addiction module toxin, RelE/StbE family [Gardnerella vaginalis]
MLTLTYTSQFKKDMKLIRKRGYDTHLVDILLEKLRNEEVLDESYQDHPLKGKYRGFRECHVKPDWLLIYRIDNDDVVLVLSRTGTHSDVFNE